MRDVCKAKIVILNENIVSSFMIYGSHLEVLFIQQIVSNQTVHDIKSTTVVSIVVVVLGSGCCLAAS